MNYTYFLENEYKKVDPAKLEKFHKDVAAGGYMKSPGAKMSLKPNKNLNKKGTKPKAQNIRQERDDGIVEIRQHRGHPEYSKGFKLEKETERQSRYLPDNEHWANYGDHEQIARGLKDRLNQGEEIDPMDAWEIQAHGNYARAKEQDDGTFGYEDSLGNFQEMDPAIHRGIEEIEKYAKDTSGHVNMFLRYGGLDKPGDEPSWQRLGNLVGTGGSGADELNYADDDTMKGMVNDMLAAFKDQQSLVEEEPRHYRRQLDDTGMVFEGIQPGNIITDPGFLSTSRNEYWAIDPEDEHPAVVMDIFGGKGRFNVPPWMAAFAPEQETIFEPGTRLRFVGMNDNGDYMFDQEGFDRFEHEIEESFSLQEAKKGKSRMNRGGLHVYIERPKPAKSFQQFSGELDNDD